MLKTPLFLLGATLLTALAARADVSWQHTGSVSVDGRKMVTFDFNNSWSGANHRALLKYDATAMADVSAMMGGPMMTDQMAKGQLSLIERLDDDRLVVAVPSANTYIDEPYSTLKERLRLNIWEGLDASLGKGEIPELTSEQRERLGDELRASLSPFTRRLTRTYFRALPEKRVIKGLNCRGYRYTTLVNTSGNKSGNNWSRFTAEWWLAEVLPGDQEIVDFTQRANKVKAEGGPLSQSMWANEYFPVLWQVAPPELHRALGTLVGYEGADNYGFRGTPAQFFLTGSIPPTKGQGKTNTFRVALELQARHQNAVVPATFAAPTGLKRQPIEPFLQLVKNGVKELRANVEQSLDAEFGPKQPVGPPMPNRAMRPVS